MPVRPTLPPSDSPHASLEAQRFHHGLDLFNLGQFFEAHEAWEDLWHEASGERKRFYQGLIQVAVSLEHVRRGNARGVRSVYLSAREKFRGLPDVYRGVDVARLLREADEALQPILSLPLASFAPGLAHGQDLPFDEALRPRIELVADPFC
ncbi:MAG: DUF309 domain-containing protein [Planctomycetota bacterium]|nr:DUF309 domain-containing protein [Planctomycetota bacterium]